MPTPTESTIARFAQPPFSQHKELFEKLTHLEQSESQATFLSIGGRGYYENPASDLLQFFFRPDNAHGLGALFIDAFLEVANFEGQPKATGRLTVQRELGTDDRKRIDLVVGHSDWLLMIENKIWHHQNNPFDSYEKLASQLASGRERHFAVLSPSGDSERDNWTGVSYADFIAAIDKRLAKCTTEQKASKWFHFAQDFTLHLTQELYQQAMTPEEIAFVEEHQQQLNNLADLQKRYRKSLGDHLCELVNEASGTETPWAKDEKWAIRIFHPNWKGSNIAWWHDADNEHNLSLTVYLEELPQSSLPQAKSFFEETHKLHQWQECEGKSQYWTTMGTTLSKEEAEAKVQAFTREIDRLYKTA